MTSLYPWQDGWMVTVPCESVTCNYARHGCHFVGYFQNTCISKERYAKPKDWFTTHVGWLVFYMWKELRITQGKLRCLYSNLNLCNYKHRWDNIWEAASFKSSSWESKKDHAREMVKWNQGGHWIRWWLLIKEHLDKQPVTREPRKIISWLPARG